MGALKRTARRILWTLLTWLHLVGMSRSISRAANRFQQINAFPYVRRRQGGNVQVLVYHRVTQRQDSFLPSVSLTVFRQQMECLARRFRVLELSEAVEALEDGDVPPNAVVVTFDDGYRDNFEEAYPVLTALSLPATIFLTTGVVGTNRFLWHDRVFRMFRETGAGELRGFGLNGECHSLDGEGQKDAACYSALRYLRTLAPGSRDEQIDRLAENLDMAKNPPEDRLMLNWDEVGEMHQNGITFGSHTVTHPVMSRISIDQAQAEILNSKREIESRLRASVTTFAYPNGRPGDFDETTKGLIEDAGYRCAVTTIFGTNSPRDLGWNRFELRRGGPEDENPGLFEAKMNAYRFLS